MVTNSKEYARKYYQEHREAYREAARRFAERKRLEKKLRVSNPRLFDMKEDYKTPTREEFQEIPKKELTYSQKYYAENRERIREQQRLSRKKKKINAKQREYYAKNKEHLQELSRKNYAKRQREKRLSKSFIWRTILRVERFVKWK